MAFNRNQPPHDDSTLAADSANRAESNDVTKAEVLKAEVLDRAAESAPRKQSHVISRVLSPAIKLWLRSQLEQVENLVFTVESGDRQLLGGLIDQVEIAAQPAVYQGLHFTQVALVAEQIRTNLGQVLRGKPLRLLHPFPIRGEVQLSATDLNQSLRSPLLEEAIKDFLRLLLEADSGTPDAAVKDWQLHQPQATLGDGQITLSASLIGENGKETPVAIRTGLVIEQGNRLLLRQPQWLPHARASRGLPLKELDGYGFDLGDQVQIEELVISPAVLICRGQLLVLPAID